MKTSALALAVLASMVTDATGQSPALFRTPIQDLGTQWTTPTQGRIPHGDLDGDGLVDLLVPDNANAVVTVWIGTGDGRFSAAPAVATAADPSDVAVADVDGDGALDFAVACDAANVVQIHRGNGAGGFALLQTIPALPGTANVLLHDFDADGDEDLLAGHHVGFTTFTNTPAGFVAGATLVLPSALTLRAVRVGAVDTDGKTDLFVLADLGAIVTFKGDGLGGFAGGVTTILPGLSPASVAFDVGDVGGDGDDDVIATADSVSTRYTYSLENDGTGGLSVIATSSGGGGAFVQLHDLTGDEALDLWHQGGGIRLGGQAFGFPYVDFFPAAVYHWASAVADVDADGRADLLALRSTTYLSTLNTLTVYRTDSHGHFGGQPPPLVEPALGCGTQHVLTTDVEGDGDLDLVQVCLLHHVHVSWNDGHGHFQNPHVVPISLGFAQVYHSALLVDLDANGADELYLGSYGTYRMTPDGQGAYAPATSFIPAPSGVPIRAMTSGDINGDGNLDLVIAAEPLLEFHLGDGAGNVSPGGSVSHALSPQAGLALADLNNDGRLDLLATRHSNFVDVRLGNGIGQFALPVSYPTAGPTPRDIAIGDFDQNGATDVVVSQAYNGSVLLGTGSGGLLLPKVLSAENIGLDNLAVGDFDGDLLPDIAANTGHDLRIFLGDGLGGFPVVDSYALTGTRMAAADLDGDGTLDIATNGPSVLIQLTPVAPCTGTIITYGTACPGEGGFAPILGGFGCASPGGHVQFELSGGVGAAPALIVLGPSPASASLGFGCSAWIAPFMAALPLQLFGVTPGTGSASTTIELPASVLPGTVHAQAFVADAANPLGFTASNGLALNVQ